MHARNFVLTVLSTLLLLASSQESDKEAANKALMEACMSEQGIDDPTAVQAALDNGADINTTDPASGQSPFMAAVLRGKIAIVKYLHQQGADIEQGETNGYKPAHGAAFQGRVDVMKFCYRCSSRFTDVRILIFQAFP